MTRPPFDPMTPPCHDWPKPDPPHEPCDAVQDQIDQDDGPVLYFDPVAYAAHLATL